MTRASSPSYIPLTIGGFAPHTIQRIVGLTPEAHAPKPRQQTRRYRAIFAPSIGIVGQRSHATRVKTNDATPLDTDRMPVNTDGYERFETEPYDGFVETPDIPDIRNRRDPWVASLTPNVPVKEGIDTQLEAEADRILAAGEYQRIETVPGLAVQNEEPRHRSFHLSPRVIPTAWTMRPVQYTLGHKACPRCNGNASIFGKGRCHYCKGEGGWAITRTRLTPYHPDHGYQLTPPRMNYTPAAVSLGRKQPRPWRVNGPFYGQTRYRRTTTIHQHAIAERIAA